MDGTSAQATLDRFNTKDAAAKYARALVGTAVHRREERCIGRALSGLGAGARVLDLPCGAGRLLPLLVGSGFCVTAADSSLHMVDEAREMAARHGFAEAVRFAEANVFATGFDDDEFDAVVCNRLFHHFSEPDVRRKAFAELGRICRGPVVVSFFCTLAIDAGTLFLRDRLRRRRPNDRIPVSLRAIRADAGAAGLLVRKVLPVRPAISRQWYVVAERRRAQGAAPAA
jgi:SAM-dependent methyltransferase